MTKTNGTGSKDLRGRPFPSAPMSHLFSHPLWTVVLEPSLNPSSEAWIHLPLVLLLSTQTRVNHCVLSSNSYETSISSSASSLHALQAVTIKNHKDIKGANHTPQSLPEPGKGVAGSRKCALQFHSQFTEQQQQKKVTAPWPDQKPQK